MTTDKKRSELRERGGTHSEDERDEDTSSSSLLHHSFDVAPKDDDDNDKSGKAAALSLRGGRHHALAVRRSFPQTLRDLQLRWKLLNIYSRIVCTILLLLLVQHVVVGILDLLGGRTQDWPVRSTETSYAVVINTYKRPEMLRQAVQHYAQTCGPATGVAQVFVVWAELDVVPPTPQALLKTSTRRQRRNSKKGQATVEIIRVAKDSLNSRFLPIAAAQSPAIFMVDDDVSVDCVSLQRGFDAWRTNPDAMVGYYPRLALESDHGGYVYQAWPGVYWRQAANFILTKACFLHSKYMALYSDATRHPVAILDYVDKYKNCEDVAMSLLVANQTMSSKNQQSSMPPSAIYVEGHVSDKGLFTGGISTQGKSQHFDHRSACLRDMTAMYTARGWPTPLRQTYALRDMTWIRHFPGLDWQIRPSNFFEWFAFQNMFKS